MGDTGDGHDSPWALGVLAGLDHQGGEEVAEEEVAQVVGGHVQLQVVLGHVLLGEGDAGVEYQDVKSVKESVLDLVDVRT